MNILAMNMLWSQTNLKDVNILCKMMWVFGEAINMVKSWTVKYSVKDVNIELWRCAFWKNKKKKQLNIESDPLQSYICKLSYLSVSRVLMERMR